MTTEEFRKLKTLPEMFDLLSRGCGGFIMMAWDDVPGGFKKFGALVTLKNDECLKVNQLRKYKKRNERVDHYSNNMWIRSDDRTGKYSVKTSPGISGELLPVADFNYLKRLRLDPDGVFPVYYMNQLAIDKFDGEAVKEHRDYDDLRNIFPTHWCSGTLLYAVFARRSAPEFIFKRSRTKDLKSMRELREYASKRHQKNTFLKSFGGCDLLSMIKIMDRKSSGPIKKKIVERCALRHLRKAKRKAGKKVTKREQTFFSMLLGAKKFQALEAGLKQQGGSK